MANISFLLAEDNVFVEAHIHDFTLPIPTEEDIRLLFESSKFGKCMILDDNLPQVIAAFPKKKNEGKEESVLLKEPLIFTVAKKLDACLEINVDADLMQASAHLVTAYGGDNYTPEVVINHLIDEISKELPEGFANQLRQNRDIRGLKGDVIERICNESLTAEPGTKFNEVIAKGLLPEEGTPTVFEYLVTPFQDRILAPQENDQGNVDMRELGKIEMVDVGDNLVRRIKSKPGANGFNIAGEVLHSVAPENLNLIAGEGTKISDTDPALLIATQDGVPIRIENGMLVSKTLILDRVDLSVGNIDFDGTLIVKGDVAPQMQIKVTHDVVVEGIAESCTIEANGNITVLQGVIGQDKNSNAKQIGSSDHTACIKAGNDINIRYAQAAYLEAKNDVIVSSQLLHCHTVAEKNVIVGEDGQKQSKLIGGQVHALKISAGEIGTPASSKIVIDLSDKIRSLQKQHYELMQLKIEKQQSVEKIEDIYKKLRSKATTPELETQCNKIKTTIEHIATEIESIDEEELAVKSEIKTIKNKLHVNVYGQIYPGVEFIVCDEKYKTQNRVPACTIRFSNDQMRYDSLQGDSKK